MNYIYYFQNYKEEIIYVGKTNDIKRRMKEHFLNGHLSKDCYLETNKIMYSEINDSKYDTEIIETLMINKYKPKYNKEKKFNENFNKTIFNLSDFIFKQIYVYFLEDKIYITNNFKYPCFDKYDSIKDRCEKLLKYNIGNLNHKIGIYKNLTSDIYSRNRNIYNIVKDLYVLVKDNINYKESDLDEPITENSELDSTYVAFNIDIIDKMNLSAKIILLLEYCGFIFRINDNLYGIPLHTENVIKNINLRYKK